MANAKTAAEKEIKAEKAAKAAESKAAAAEETPVTDKGAVAVKLKVNRACELDGAAAERGKIVTIHETTFMAEIAKGLEKREDKHPVSGVMNVVSHNPTSPYLNHCRLVSCSDKARKAYDKLIADKEA